jgi:hypothetical protein
MGARCSTGSPGFGRRRIGKPVKVVVTLPRQTGPDAKFAIEIRPLSQDSHLYPEPIDKPAHLRSGSDSAIRRCRWGRPRYPAWKPFWRLTMPIIRQQDPDQTCRIATFVRSCREPLPAGPPSVLYPAPDGLGCAGRLSGSGRGTAPETPLRHRTGQAGPVPRA